MATSRSLSSTITVAMTTITESVEEEEEGDDSLPPWTLGLAGAAMAVLIILSVLGNLLVIISYFRDRQLQTAHNVYIVNLASADLLTATISMTFYADATLRNWNWIYGRAVCKMWCVNDYIMSLVSVVLILLLSWDRVVLLRNGTAYMARQTRKVAKIKVTIAWCLSITVYAPIVIFYDVVRGHSVIEDGTCEAEFLYDSKFSIVSAVFELITPAIILTVLNTMVFLAIRKRLDVFNKRKLNTVSPVENTVMGEISTVATDFDANRNAVFPETGDGNRKTKRSKYSDRRDLKAARSLAVLVIAFVVCWTPYTVTNFVASLCDDCVADWFYEFVTWLLWAKAFINPLLYASQSQRFKDNFIKLLPCFRAISKPSVNAS